MALFMISELSVYCSVYRHQLNISPLLYVLDFFLNLDYCAKFKSVSHPYNWPIRKSILSDLTVAQQISRFSCPNPVCCTVLCVVL